MTFTILGGDLRSVYLAHRLLRDGHTVRTFGLELADIPPPCRSDTLQEALWETQCVLLPTPAAVGGLLRTPFGCVPLPVDAVAAAIPRGVRIFGGALNLQLREALAAQGLYAVDLLSDEALTIRNASITAQCALRLLSEQLPHCIAGHRVLILGAGRIGKLLGLQLKALGADVTVAARSPADRAWCAALGLATADIADLSAILLLSPIVVNTVPARILDDRLLRHLPHGALLLELASAPGGFDAVHAESMGLHPVHGGGLPGKYAPQSAANAIAETIYAELER